MNEIQKARVFLSCGQRKNDQEEWVATKVHDAIEECGFDCYLATDVQSLRSLRENIFEELEIADYFVFIDFSREPIGHRLHRGSLFAHQELAIASFLQLPFIGFQEKGVKELDGMLSAFQANVHRFLNRRNLHTIVRKRISEKLKCSEWSRTSRNSLTMLKPESVDSTLRQTGITSRYFQIPVRNNHARKPALDCFVYLESVVDIVSGERFIPETVEFKWAGTLLPSVRISPGSQRRFDALHFPISTPDRIKRIAFNVHADSTQFYPWQLNVAGRYELVYAVVSQNFPTARESFFLEYGETLPSIQFGVSSRDLLAT